MQNGNRDGCRHLKGLEGRARPHALLLLMILQRVRLGVAQTTISSPFETIFFLITYTFVDLFGTFQILTRWKVKLIYSLRHIFV